MGNLFREEVLQARRPKSLGTIRLAVPVSQQIWGIAAAATTVAIALWLYLGHYTQRVHVAGSLVPQAGVLDIVARDAGTITGLEVKAGERVRAGQSLLTISDDRSSATLGDTAAIVGRQLRAQIEQTQATLADVQPQAQAQARDLRARIAMLRSQIAKFATQLALQRKQADVATQFVHKIEPLVQRGIVSTAQFDQYQANALTDQMNVQGLQRQQLDTRQQMSALEAQLAQLPLDTAAKSNQLRSQLAQLQAQMATNAVERESMLRAPRAGVVSSLLVKPGQAISAGQSLLFILPANSPLEAQLLVPSNAIGFVHKGTPVVLHYPAFPYQKFGVQHGTVIEVSRNALSPAEVTALLGEAPPPVSLYRIEVKLAKQSIEAYGKQQALLPGMALNADLLLDRRRMVEWIFEPLYGMARRNGGHA